MFLGKLFAVNRDIIVGMPPNRYAISFPQATVANFAGLLNFK